MPTFLRQTETEFQLIDPTDEQLITSTQIPNFLASHERYGPGLAYLQQKAGSVAVSLHFVEHVAAVDLGEDFETKVTSHDTLALEDNGWTDDIFRRIQSFAAGQSLSEFLLGLGPQYNDMKAEIADHTTYYGRLYRAIELARPSICIADIPDRTSGPYEDQVHYMWRQSRKNAYLPALSEAAIALREWFMIANLGVHLSSYDQEKTNVLQVVGANHFLLQDKLMTLGILPEVEVASGNGQLGDATDLTSTLFALRSIGRASNAGLDSGGRVLQEDA